MKALLRRLVTLSLALLLLLPSALAFSPVREGVEFSDVPDNHWGRSYVWQMYRYGLMSGTGGGLFSPGGALSVAEAVTVTVRVRDLYNGGDGVIDQSGANWYDNAVDETLALGIITQGQFESYTRAELAGLLVKALPSEEFALLPVPADLTVYSSSKRLLIDGFPLYGLTVIDGKYYVPADLLDDENSAAWFLMDTEKESDGYSIKYYGGSTQSIPLLNYSAIPPEGKVMGTADPNPLTLTLNGQKVQGGGREPLLEQGPGGRPVALYGLHLGRPHLQDPHPAA